MKLWNTVMPVSASAPRMRQWRRITARRRSRSRQVSGSRISSASSQRQKLNAIGGISSCAPRPTTMLVDQKKAAPASSR